MSKNSAICNIFKSALPERTLIRRHDILALALKYSLRTDPIPLTGWRKFLKGAIDEDVDADYPAMYSTMKRLGSLIVQTGCPLETAGVDPKSGLRLGGTDASNITQLHMLQIDGAQDALHSLELAAEYMVQQPAVRANNYIAAVTYAELAKAAAKVGFKAMNIETLPDKPRMLIEAFHDAVYTMKGVEDIPPTVPAMVYMPTEAFISNFGA